MKSGFLILSTEFLEQYGSRFMKIDRHTILADLLKKESSVHQVLDRYNLACARCKGSVEESLEKIAINSGLDLDTFLSEIKEAIGTRD